MGWDPKTCLHTSSQTPPSTEQIARQRQVLSLTAWGVSAVVRRQAGWPWASYWTFLWFSHQKMGGGWFYTNDFIREFLSTKSQNALKMLICTALQAVSKFKPLYPCLGTIFLISFQVPYSLFSSFHLIHHRSCWLSFIMLAFFSQAWSCPVASYGRSKEGLPWQLLGTLV